ncbi:MAG: NAD-dependent epimerase/dehydratase family protein [Chloroflexota bacterium]
MKILVTGGAGFIGSNVVDAYVEAGHQVVVVDDLSSGNRANLNPAAAFYQVDIRSEQLLEVMGKERPEVVNHHAAQIDVRRSVADPRYDASINVDGSIALLEACRKTGVRKVIYISSGGAMYGEPEYLPCDENHPVRPLSPYGATKHTVEHYVYMYRENFGISYTVLRYPNVYGPRQDPFGEAGVIAIFTERMLKGEPVTINGTGEQERDFIYVGDCVSANLLSLEGGDGREYNLGWGIPVTVNQVFDSLKQATGYRLEANYGPAKTGETFRIYLDTARIRKELGWEPRVPLDEGIARTVSFFRERE